MNIENPHIDLGAACVYHLTSPSGKMYIGKTVLPLEERILAHSKAKFIIGNALRKYGLDAFRSEIVVVGSEEFCYEMERRLINAQQTLYPRGYNIREGGLGLTSEEAKQFHNSPRMLELHRQHGKSSENLAQLAKMRLLPHAVEARKRWETSPENLERLAEMRNTPEAVQKRLDGGNSSRNLAMLKKMHESEFHKKVLLRGTETRVQQARERDEFSLKAIRAAPVGLTIPQLVILLEQDLSSVKYRIQRLRRLGKITSIRRDHLNALYEIKEPVNDSNI